MFQTAVSLNTTQGLVDDYNNRPVHQAIFQARNFIRGRANPLSYYDAIASNLKLLAGEDEAEMLNILNATELRIILIAEKALKASVELRKKTTKGPKAADLYRRYAPTLRKIFARNGEYARDAQDTLLSLYLEQTLPDGELETPDYKDGYTGERIEEELGDDRPNNAKVTGPATEIVQAANIAAADLGWSEVVLTQFVKANMGGYSEFATEDEDQREDREFVPFTLQKDFEIDQEGMAAAQPFIHEFNQARSRIFGEMKEEGVNGATWRDAFRQRITETASFHAMIECVREAARENTVTGAAVYLKVEGEYGLREEDVRDVRVYEDAYSTLLDFLEENENDILELMHDAAFNSRTEEDDWWAIEEFDKDTAAKLAGKMPKYDVNPVKTASWNIGFVRAIANGADLKEAETAAWSAWRKEMSPKGDIAYSTVLMKGGDRKAAMSAFWKECGRNVPRPQQKIKAICRNKTGLVLENGREISWTIAMLKAKNNELDLNDETRHRLIAKLMELGVGRQFVDAIRI